MGNIWRKEEEGEGGWGEKSSSLGIGLQESGESRETRKDTIEVLLTQHILCSSNSPWSNLHQQ